MHHRHANVCVILFKKQLFNDNTISEENGYCNSLIRPMIKYGSKLNLNIDKFSTNEKLDLYGNNIITYLGSCSFTRRIFILSMQI